MSTTHGIFVRDGIEITVMRSALVYRLWIGEELREDTDHGIFMKSSEPLKSTDIDNMILQLQYIKREILEIEGSNRDLGSPFPVECRDDIWFATGYPKIGPAAFDQSSIILIDDLPPDETKKT